MRMGSCWSDPDPQLQACLVSSLETTGTPGSLGDRGGIRQTAGTREPRVFWLSHSEFATPRGGMACRIWRAILAQRAGSAAVTPGPQEAE